MRELGPRLRLADPVVLSGDETSFAAGRALRDVRRATPVFEVDDEAGGARRSTLVRAHLKANGALRSAKTKAYWSAGKAGLD